MRSADEPLYAHGRVHIATVTHSGVRSTETDVLIGHGVFGDSADERCRRGDAGPHVESEGRRHLRLLINRLLHSAALIPGEDVAEASQRSFLAAHREQMRLDPFRFQVADDRGAILVIGHEDGVDVRVSGKSRCRKSVFGSGPVFPNGIADPGSARSRSSRESRNRPGDFAYVACCYRRS